MVKTTEIKKSLYTLLIEMNGYYYDLTKEQKTNNYDKNHPRYHTINYMKEYIIFNYNFLLKKYKNDT
jgi:hypothetical protein